MERLSEQLPWTDFLKIYNDRVKGKWVECREWHLLQKELWRHVRAVTEEQVKTSDCTYMPLYIRWILARQYPDLLKKLLIDTVSYELNQEGGVFWRIRTGQPDSYLKKHLIPMMHQHHDPKMSFELKPMIANAFGYRMH